MWDENLFKELTKVEAGHVSFGDASKKVVKGWGYNLVPAEEQPSWRNQIRVLCTRS